ncbi:hypothetical protein [Chryseobacterium sp. 3008163]|uniref:hypothetical protein n=1 Tax=Chryseobacterium sp. 3008163 TaxID=2478663 RepID=UPI000F0BE7CE|nr:hypothetical protein [Chryseobacterium sp. 3008163]AYN00628.1 hypothetical protein EAG08_10145 [Chryseobacterium sp. 3008163]
MEIVYLKKYKQYKENGIGKLYNTFGSPRGLSEAEILQMELEMNNGLPFPKAYREFLFLGGEFSTIQLNHYGKKTPKGTEFFKSGLKKEKLIWFARLPYLMYWMENVEHLFIWMRGIIHNRKTVHYTKLMTMMMMKLSGILPIKLFQK